MRQSLRAARRAFQTVARLSESTARATSVRTTMASGFTALSDATQPIVTRSITGAKRPPRPRSIVVANVTIAATTQTMIAVASTRSLVRPKFVT